MTSERGGGRESAMKKKKFSSKRRIFIVSSKWVVGRAGVQMKGIMEMRMETVPARHTGDLCTGLICKWRDDEEEGVINFTSWELDDKVSVSFQFFWQFFVHFEIEICADYCERKARQCGNIFGELRPNVIVRILSQGDYIGMYMYVWYVYWYSPKERQLPAHTTGQIGTLGNSAMRGLTSYKDNLPQEYLNDLNDS